MGKFIIKHINTLKPQKKVNVTKENKINENKSVMTTSEKIAMVKDVINNTPSTTKRIKKDKELIERTESSKTILTEDNKELLKD